MYLIKKTKMEYFGLAVLIFLWIMTMGTAQTIQLPSTGQTTSVVPGDDGDLQMGVPWPDPRFTDNGDGTINDNLIGLIWVADASTPTVDSCAGGAMSWTDALAYVACLNAAKHLGINTWRLPNVVELESLINCGVDNNSAWMSSQGFSGVEYGYWTSTTYAAMTSDAWFVSLQDGGVFNSQKNTTWFVLVVTGTSDGPAQLWRTGQTTSYAESDDGDLQQGAEWPDPRFTDNGDGTIADNLTGLAWAQDFTTAPVTKNTPTPMTWQESLDQIQNANSADWSGHGDWIMPNRKQLFSRINFGESSNLIWMNSHGFEGLPDQWAGYWSSTPLGTNTRYPFIWVSDQGHGHKFIDSPDSSWYPTAARYPFLSIPYSHFNNHWAAIDIEPVDMFNGELFHEDGPELYLGGPMPLYWQRYFATYLRRSFVAGPSGLNWRHNFDFRLMWSGTVALYIDNRGRVTRFLRQGISGPFIQQNNLDTPYQLIIAPGSDPVLSDPHTDYIYTFDYHRGGPVTGKVWLIEDGKGNAHTITYDENGDLEQISDGLGRSLTITFDGDWLVGTVADQGGRSVRYEYDDDFEDSHLIRSYDALNQSTEYQYADTVANTRALDHPGTIQARLRGTVLR